MKKYLNILLVFVVFGCQNQESNSKEKIVIKECMASNIILLDTNKLNVLANNYDYMTLGNYYRNSKDDIKYMNKKEFNMFLYGVKEYLNNPGSYVYTFDAKKASKNDLRAIYTLCDSIDTYEHDSNGNETIVKKWFCDSTSRINSIDRVEFYEQWYLNKEDYTIEKKILGYSLYSFDSDKEFYRHLFYVFKDSSAVTIARNNDVFW